MAKRGRPTNEERAAREAAADEELAVDQSAADADAIGEEETIDVSDAISSEDLAVVGEVLSILLNFGFAKYLVEKFKYLIFFFL